jgi:ABC-2 type transport system ATP-binding protein
VHRPELVVIDEPFTALDPINTQLVKDIMKELREQGSTILMSTHQMHQVEELCDRIVLIDDGRDVLYGDLDEIRKENTGHAVIIRTTGELPELQGVDAVVPLNNSLRLSLSASTSPQEILRSILTKEITLEKFEIAVPTLDEIFIKVVEDGAKDG